jgi:hypothetical protein
VSRPWEVDFVAVSAALGEPMSAVAEALGNLGSAGALRAGELLPKLQGGTKSERAIALAAALAQVVTDLERMELQ